ncbi:MAG: cytochrome ubiquinol oxidase subunit I [Anaerolineae bacterium]|nr:cytochrome ubiquinol oxidase subunit I [Anaerolineae bacterium]
MDPVVLARWQFALTASFHFLIVPLTIGLSLYIAILETRYVRTGDRLYKRMAQFWGRFFILNYAVGVVSGLVLEFQFGMNWSNFSRMMGNIMGGPLAAEALFAFFLESTFLGLWIFGWRKLSPKLHLTCIWLVVLGALLSAQWILAVNAFMQKPVGYTLEQDIVTLVDFWALLTNPYLFYQLAHTLSASITTGAFFILGISAWQLIRQPSEAFRRSLRFAAVYGLIGALLVAGVGHAQGQYLERVQTMKMAAAEAHWQTEKPAAFSLIAGIDETAQSNPWAIRIPYLLGILAYNNPKAEVKGILELQEYYVIRYGEGNYIPPVALIFWSFRIMVISGLTLIALAVWLVFRTVIKKRDPARWLLRVLPLAMILPYAANTTGWIMAESGRQPWAVYGLMRTEYAFSPAVTAGQILFSLISFVVIYALLLAADIYLMVKHVQKQAPSLHDSRRDAEEA